MTVYMHENTIVIFKVYCIISILFCSILLHSDEPKRVLIYEEPNYGEQSLLSGRCSVSSRRRESTDFEAFLSGPREVDPTRRVH